MRRSGFTMIEMIIVIVIFGTISTSIWSMFGFMQNIQLKWSASSGLSKIKTDADFLLSDPKISGVFFSYGDKVKISSTENNDSIDMSLLEIDGDYLNIKDKPILIPALLLGEYLPSESKNELFYILRAGEETFKGATYNYFKITALLSMDLLSTTILQENVDILFEKRDGYFHLVSEKPEALDVDSWSYISQKVFTEKIDGRMAMKKSVELAVDNIRKIAGIYTEWANEQHRKSVYQGIAGGVGTNRSWFISCVAHNSNGNCMGTNQNVPAVKTLIPDDKGVIAAYNNGVNFYTIEGKGMDSSITSDYGFIMVPGGNTNFNKSTGISITDKCPTTIDVGADGMVEVSISGATVVGENKNSCLLTRAMTDLVPEDMTNPFGYTTWFINMTQTLNEKEIRVVIPATNNSAPYRAVVVSFLPNGNPYYATIQATPY